MDMVKIYEGSIMKDLVIDSSLVYGNTNSLLHVSTFKCQFIFWCGSEIEFE